jgi:hypothetical protein
MTVDDMKATLRVLEAMQKGPGELQIKAAWDVVAREREKRLAAERALRDLEIDSADEITALKGQLRQKQNEIDRLNRSWQTREIERLKDLVETLVGTREPAPPAAPPQPAAPAPRKNAPVLSPAARQIFNKTS